MCCEILFELFVDAKARSGVGYLAEEGGAEAAVKTEDAIILEDMDEG